MNKRKYDIVSVLPDRASKTKVSLLHHLGVKIFRAPEESSDNKISKESPSMMAEFLTTKIDNSYVLDPFLDPMNKETHFWWTGQEIVRQFEDQVDMLVCGYETGGMISGISPVIKHSNQDCITIGADMSGKIVTGNPGQDKNKYRHDTCSVEEYSSPDLSDMINLAVADKWYPVPWKEAFCKARELLLMEGIPASPGAGAVLHATLEAIKDFGFANKKDKKVLLILDNSAMYTDFEYASNDWMIGNNYLTLEDIESTVWFHKIHTWRIPVKVPVTVFDDFNAYAVYSMMNSERVNRVVVCDVATKSIIGIASLPLLNKNIEAGLITRVTLIGNSYCISRSFQTISIHKNISALLELLKVHSYAILVQRQKIASAAKTLEQEWLAGILDAEDVIRFIVELEQCHSKKFGAVLAGGFQSVSLWKSTKPDEDKNISEDTSPKSILQSDVNVLATTIAPKLATPVVMYATVEVREESNNASSENPSELNHPAPTVNPISTTQPAPTLVPEMIISSSNNNPDSVWDNHFQQQPNDVLAGSSYLPRVAQQRNNTSLRNSHQAENAPPKFHPSTNSDDPITPSAPFSPVSSEFFYDSLSPTRAPTSSAVFVSKLPVSDHADQEAPVSSDSTIQIDLEVVSSSIIQIEVNSDLSSPNNSDLDLHEDMSALSVSESIFRAMYSSEQVQHGIAGAVSSNIFMSPSSSATLSHASSSNVVETLSSFFMLPVAATVIPYAPVGHFRDTNDSGILPSATTPTSVPERAREEDMGTIIPQAPAQEATLSEELKLGEKSPLKESNNTHGTAKISLVTEEPPTNVTAPDKSSDGSS
ncbi:unnamed protein product [Allacma fusca]|uniref:Tryptophan synthase beta chain-like PALP domain-containing protein n=1 Tax=Allacma fusca TaxID=39272 RepID=A0A8J2JPE1_9HEXA|nr:unnamed protein product [Allacma fusca]